MPIYEYACKSCGETFEVFMNSSDKPVKKCENCSSTKIQKLISNCSFQLKGTGWYATDYANKDKNTGAKGKKKDAEKGTADAPAKTEPSAAAESSSEKKPASTENKAA